MRNQFVLQHFSLIYFYLKTAIFVNISTYYVYMYVKSIVILFIAFNTSKTGLQIYDFMYKKIFTNFHHVCSSASPRPVFYSENYFHIIFHIKFQKKKKRRWRNNYVSIRESRRGGKGDRCGGGPGGRRGPKERREKSNLKKFIFSKLYSCKDIPGRSRW